MYSDSGIPIYVKLGKNSSGFPLYIVCAKFDTCIESATTGGLTKIVQTTLKAIYITNAVINRLFLIILSFFDCSSLYNLSFMNLVAATINIPAAISPIM